MTRPISLPAIATVARRDGLAAGLTAAFDLRAPVPCSPAGRTLIPPGLLPVVGEWSLSDGAVPAVECRVEIEPHDVARAEHLALVRVTRTHRDTRGTPVRPDRPASGWPAALLAVRAGVGRRLLGRAIDELSGRTSDGIPLTERQLVRAEVAEIAITLEAVETVLAGHPAGIETEPWHGDLDRSDEALARLFGAGGYVDDHPARALRLVGLLRDVYAPAEIRVAA